MNYKQTLTDYNFAYVRTLCLKCNGGKVIEVYKNPQNPKAEVHIYAKGDIFRIKRLGITKFTGKLSQLKDQLIKL